MTRWGLLLLASYIGLGLSNLAGPRAVRYAVLLTVVVLAGVGIDHGAL